MSIDNNSTSSLRDSIKKVNTCTCTFSDRLLLSSRYVETYILFNFKKGKKITKPWPCLEFTICFQVLVHCNILTNDNFIIF